MKKLTIGSFKREGGQGSFGHTFTHFTEDGREVCLESCLEGYCVGIYDRNQNLIGEKTCTKIGGMLEMQIMPGFSIGTGEALERAIKIANEKLTPPSKIIKTKMTKPNRLKPGEEKMVEELLGEVKAPDGYSFCMHHMGDCLEDPCYCEYLENAKRERDKIKSSIATIAENREKEARLEERKEVMEFVDKMRRWVFKDVSEHEFVDTCDLYKLLKISKNK